MPEISGTELSRFCPELTSFGTSTPTWKRCWETLQVCGLAWFCSLILVDQSMGHYPRKQVQCVVLFKIIFLVEWNRCRIVDFHCVCEVIFVVIKGGRQVFERWMEWEPEEQAWHSYINFELRYKELDRARMIYERYILFHFLNFRILKI